MGQTLSEPVTSKESSSMEDDFFKVGSSCMQGWRFSMEDSHTHILKLNEDRDSAFFGVYDGHGGAKIANFLSKNLHKFMVRQTEYVEGNYAEAIRKGFLECDAYMRSDDDLTQEFSGSTAITALIRQERHLVVANVGDSRCIGFVGGKTLALSVDHKPADLEESLRIEEAGGFVELGRVNGNLALSRAFGDYMFKVNLNLPPERQIVSCVPGIVEKDIDEDWDFILLACDGIWDVLKNEEVSLFVARRIAQSKEPETICEELMTHCLAKDTTMAGFGCDNMSVILVCFLHEKPYSRLVSKCAKYVSDEDRKRAADGVEDHKELENETRELNEEREESEDTRNDGRPEEE